MTTVPNWTGTLPNGWTGGEALTKWWRNTWVHLYTLRKPCAQCQGEMRIDVSKAALEGRAKNAGLHLARCAKCRAASRALGSSSRPKIAGQEPFQAAPAGSELEQLRTANATMREELVGLYAQNRELREKISKYELGPYLENMTAAAQFKMPWEN